MSDYFQTENWKNLAQHDLPFLPSPHETIEASLDYLNTVYPLYQKQLIDLGAGDGRVIILAAKKYRMFTIGVEINLELISTAQTHIKELDLQSQCQMIEADLYNFDVSNSDVVYCFILPTSHRFLRHVIQSLKSGAFWISIRWPMDTFGEFWEREFELHLLEGVSVFIYKKK